MSMLRARARSAPRRGFVLLTVIILIGTAMMLTASVMWTARAEHAGRVANFEAVRRRAAAWSAAQAIAAMLGEQRPTVLTGGAPTLRDQLPLYDDGRSAAVLRLLPASNDGDRVLAEASLLDVNSADAASLTILGFDESTAARVAAAIGQAPGGRLASLEEIVDQAGADPKSLRGAQAFDASSLAVLHGARGDERGHALVGAGSALRDAGSALRDAGSALRSEGDEVSSSTAAGSTGAGSSNSDASASESGPALADRLTVFAVEPALTRDGKRRAELGTAWAEQMREVLGSAVTPDVAERLEAVAAQGVAIENDRGLVESLGQLGIDPSAWSDVLDRITADRGVWRNGRVDINRAPAEVLATLPGLTGEQVDRLLRERDGLDPAERASPAWLVSRGVVEPAAFAELFPRITTRSFFWRVRFVAGFTDAEDPDGALHGASIWECVVDLTADRARIASLRDLTMVPVSERLMEAHRRVVDARPDNDGDEDEGEHASRLDRVAEASVAAAANAAAEIAAALAAEIADAVDARESVAQVPPPPRRERARGGSRPAPPSSTEPAEPEAVVDKRPPPAPGPVGRFRLRPGAPGGSDGNGAATPSAPAAYDFPFDPKDDAWE